MVHYVNSKDIISICVDAITGGSICGRLYHCYTEAPIEFNCVLGIINELGVLMESTDTPKSSVEFRKFHKKGAPAFERRETEMKTSPQEVVCQKGEKGTFVVRIRHRQNATWQGSVTWAEHNSTQNFRSALELIKLIDCAFDASGEVFDAELDSEDESAS